MAENRATDRIPVYDRTGGLCGEIPLKEKILPIPTKRGGFSGSGLYYKGAGIVYRNHLGCSRNIEHMSGETYKHQQAQVIGKAALIYEDQILCYPELVGKFGIFPFCHQPVFSDREGGCGKKEQRFLENQKNFEKSAVDVIDVIPTGIRDHAIYCYRLKEVTGGIEDTVELLRYILSENWNTAWDKNLWEDIESCGYVRDVADWYRSESYQHKLGTVYALLVSLYRVSMRDYARLLLILFRTYDFDRKMLFYYSAKIVQKFCRAYDNRDPGDADDIQHWFPELYLTVVTGKACCHLEDDSKWDWVRTYYKNKLKNFKKKYEF